MKDYKLLRVIAALAGGHIAYDGECPHWEGLSGDMDYGMHSEAGDVMIINASSRCIIPCKHHLQFYLQSEYWKEI